MMKLSTTAFLVSFTACLSAAQAHSDVRLEQALTTAPAALRQVYATASLKAQIANVHALIGDQDRSRSLLQEATQSATGLNGYLKDDALAAIANEQASTGAFDQARSLMMMISDPPARMRLGWKLVAKLAKAGQPAEAETLLASLVKQAETVTDPLERIELLTGTGAAHKAVAPAKGQPLVLEALSLARAAAVSPHHRMMLFNEIGAHLVDVGLKPQAIALFAEAEALGAGLTDPLERAESFAMLGGERAEKGERDAATVALEEGVRAALAAPDGPEKNAVLSELSRNFGQSHRFERGLEIAATIPDPYHRAEGHLRIAKNMARNHRGEDARLLLQSTEALATDIPDPHTRGIILRKLAAEWVTLKDNNKARALLSRALTENAG